MSSERGSVTIWVLTLAVVLLLFGGLALDFWRALALQRQLAAIADSAAVAAASGIDEEHYRATGDLLLDPDRARRLAAQSIGFQDQSLVGALVDVAGDLSDVTVTVDAQVELGLLGVFVGDSEPFMVRGTATAYPRLVP